MRMKEMITSKRTSWLSNKFSLSEQWGEYMYTDVLGCKRISYHDTYKNITEPLLHMSASAYNIMMII